MKRQHRVRGAALLLHEHDRQHGHGQATGVCAEINDEAWRRVERDLDLEELCMEA